MHPRAFLEPLCDLPLFGPSLRHLEIVVAILFLVDPPPSSRPWEPSCRALARPDTCPPGHSIPPYKKGREVAGLHSNRPLLLDSHDRSSMRVQLTML